MSIDPVTLGLARTAMATDPELTTAPTGGATSQTAPQTAGKDMFLKLLVAQLKYQNPMEPVDSSQFMAQTAQFTMVEKLEAMAAADRRPRRRRGLAAGRRAPRTPGELRRRPGRGPTPVS